MNEWVSEWVSECMDEWRNKGASEWINECMHGWINKWIRSSIFMNFMQVISMCVPLYAPLYALSELESDDKSLGKHF